MDEFSETEAGTLAEESRSSVEGVRLLFVADDSPSDEFRSALESEGCTVDWTDSLECDHDGASYDVALVDRRRLDAGTDGDWNGRGIDATLGLLRVEEHTPSAYRRVVELGMDTWIRRDIGPESLLRLVEKELPNRSDEGDASVKSPPPIFGDSDAMKRICRLISGAAPSSAPTLISGESGVGKELVARAIHRLSPRRRRPFVALNCGAIPENLIESELFGHEEGAFTGATSRRVGRFEQADGGVLFLDEVGELPADLQVKLLRVLEEQTFQRVGGTDRISVDVRVLSATNQDLTVATERDEFRRDLFFRLNVLEIDVPPLREHREDIDVLWKYFLGRAATQEARRIPETSRPVLRKIIQYDWPGNIRELRNVARHSVALSAGDELTVEHLPQRFRARLERQVQAHPDRIQVPGMTLQEVERATIIRTHEWTGNAAETAEMLGISERKVYYKLKEYRENGYLSEDSAEQGGRPDESESGCTDGDESEDGKPRELLLAEDDRQLQWSLCKLLGDDYRVRTATNGRELVAEVESSRPDLIVSDIRMPGLDGIQVLRERQNEEWEIPIVLITAYGDEENRAQAELLGAEAFLDKPVDPAHLEETLRRVLDEENTASA